MRWKKLGRIYECQNFAQSPQALVFDNFIRIYFSTRTRDSAGKYLSHIAYVDFDKKMKQQLRVSNSPVISLGELGCFDEHGIFPMNVLRDKDRVLGFTSGISRRVSVSVETSIGLATSTDGGCTFTKYGHGPVLAASLHEPGMVGDPFVQKFGGELHMWYIFGQGWKRFPNQDTPERIYKIGHATSRDGIVWTKDNKQLITDSFADECQALPTVIRYRRRFHMWFCYRHASDFRTNKDRGYRLGYAVSLDLKRWTRQDDQVGISVSEKGWDSEMMCYPHVFRCLNSVYLLYNGNEFGRFGFGLAQLVG